MHVKQLHTNRIKLVIIFLLSFILNANAQVGDLLSFETPGFYLLPSETGAHNEKWVLGSYMNSKKILSNLPIRSYALAGDYQLIRGFQSIYIGGGFGSMSLVGSSYLENELYATLAYHKIIKNHSFHIGIQPGVVIRNMNTGDLLFPDQYDRNTGGFNSSIGTNEPIEFSGKAMNMNLNIGAAYGIKISKYYTKIILAYRNINKPNVSFGNSPLVINRQLIIQNKTEFYISSSDKLKAFVMLRTNHDKTETYLGGELVHNLFKYNFIMNEISAGGYLVLRNSNYPNNMVFNLGLGIQNFKIGLAYSYNFINKGDKSDFNSFELVLLFKGLNKTLDQYKVPCEIY